MTTSIAISVLFVLALLAAIPGDRARRGGASQLEALGAVMNAVLPGLAFSLGGAVGAFHGVVGFVAIMGSIAAANVLADQVATRAWGPVTNS